MGSLTQLPPRASAQNAPQTAFGLSARLVARKRSRGRRAVVHVGGLAIVCVVYEIPVAGDRIFGQVAAIVDKVRITRDGHVRIDGSPAPGNNAATGPLADAASPVRRWLWLAGEGGPSTPSGRESA